MSDATAARRLIQQLAATPRGTGSEGEARARLLCADRLRAMGFDVREQEFEYSRLPAHWGLPLAGTLLLLTGVALVLWASEGAQGLPRSLGTLGALVVIAFWLSFLLAVVRDRSHHARGTNLVATRGGPQPPIWLCAHNDTKSQPFPTLVRTIGIILAILTTLALISFYFVDTLVEDSTDIWMVLGIAATVASLPLLTSTIGDDSPGAVDNASGVAAVLLAAGETGDAPLGVVLTTAEELGLAGARAWGRSRREAGAGTPADVVINCDTLDDRGVVRCVYHRGSDRPLADGIVRHARDAGLKARRKRFTPGILLDSVSLARAGARAVTISRVTLGTLARIHTPRDTADRLTGDGAARTSAVLVAMVRDTR